jgi:glutamate--cysteine ligase
LNQWAGELFDALSPIAGILDEGHPGQPYRASIEQHRPAVADPEETLSARILREMRDNREGFAEFAMRISRQHARHWDTRSLSSERHGEFVREAEISWQKQEEIEVSDQLGFDDFLQNYWNQS